MINTGLQGKVVLVTGANHGIGATTARAFATEGASVLINYLRLPPIGMPFENIAEDSTLPPGLSLYNFKRSLSADKVVEEIRAQGGNVEALEADLSNIETIPQLFNRAESVFGPVDILVNNADYGLADTFLPESVLESTDTAPAGYALSPITALSFERHFDVNSRAVALMMAEFARRRIAQNMHWGRIINVSTDGSPGFFHEVSYGASKFAMESYSRAAASELGRYGITVNIVAPGPIQTGYITAELEQKSDRRYSVGTCRRA